VSVAVTGGDIVTTPYGGEILSTEQNTNTPENNGNNSGLAPQP
jgi:hypothetical protein